MRRRVAESAVDIKALDIRSDAILSPYKANMEKFKAQKVVSDHEISMMRQHALDVSSLKRMWPYPERSDLGDSTSLRLKLLRPLFDEEQKDEDNPYSVAAVYRYNLSKQKEMDKTVNNERNAWGNRFEEEINRKRKDIQEGKPIQNYHNKLDKVRKENEEALSQLVENYKLAPIRQHADVNRRYEEAGYYDIYN